MNPLPSRTHGGPDAAGVPRWDFSTNSNACGPAPAALQAVQQADPRHYPDPSYRALREALAAFHGVAPARVVLAASASEFIARLTAWASQQALRGPVPAVPHRVTVPRHAYGDYAHAARAWGWPVQADALLDARGPGGGAAEAAPALIAWACEPASPLGQVPAGLAAWAARAAARPQGLAVLDRAYHPLRLVGTAPLPGAALDALWQLWSPNKALGLTGVRAAYALAPAHTGADTLAALEALAPSWPLGAHGVALLQAWVQPATQDWLAGARLTLAGWKARQLALCAELGWAVQPSVANFMVVAPGPATPAHALDHLRAHGLKLRDCASFGLPGHWRLGVLPPPAQDALAQAWAAR